MRTLTTLAATVSSVLPLGIKQRDRRQDALRLGPSSLMIGTKSLAIGETTHAASFAVAGYPAEVGNGWLEPLLSYPARLDIAIHVEPVPAPVAADRLRKQRARIESGRRQSAERGRLDDPITESAAADARELAYRVACGEGRLFDVGIYLTVFADSEEELSELVAAVRSVADGILLRLVPATFRTVQGWCTTLPLGRDGLKIRRTYRTAAPMRHGWPHNAVSTSVRSSTPASTPPRCCARPTPTERSVCWNTRPSSSRGTMPCPSRSSRSTSNKASTTLPHVA